MRTRNKVAMYVLHHTMNRAIARMWRKALDRCALAIPAEPQGHHPSARGTGGARALTAEINRNPPWLSTNARKPARVSLCDTKEAAVASAPGKAVAVCSSMGGGDLLAGSAARSIPQEDGLAERPGTGSRIGTGRPGGGGRAVPLRGVCQRFSDARIGAMYARFSSASDRPEGR